MPIVLSSRTKAQIMTRRAEYLRYRLSVPITEEQYLWWDDVIANHYDEAFDVYKKLLAKCWRVQPTRCIKLTPFEVTRVKFRGVTMVAHRFTYAVHCSLPLSQKQVARHQCGHRSCLNAAHIELGDQAENFQDYLAERAYGIRNWLLPRDPLETLR